MSHTIIYNSEEHMIEIKVQGDFFLSEAREISTETAQIVKEHDCFLILNDMREAMVKLSIAEVYNFPKILAALLASSGVDVHKMKRALVVKKDLKDYAFFETVTLNRAQSTKVFFDIDEARKWLPEK